MSHAFFRSFETRETGARSLNQKLLEREVVAGVVALTTVGSDELERSGLIDGNDRATDSTGAIDAAHVVRRDAAPAGDGVVLVKELGGAGQLTRGPPADHVPTAEDPIKGEGIKADVVVAIEVKTLVRVVILTICGAGGSQGTGNVHQVAGHQSTVTGLELMVGH